MGAMKIDTGISPDHREKIAAGLERVLADSYTLYLKTHKYHWNVTGPMFQTLHVMFETQYTELALAVDEIAERIRALGALSPGSYREFGALTAIPEDDDSPDAVDDDPAAGRGPGDGGAHRPGGLPDGGGGR